MYGINFIFAQRTLNMTILILGSGGREHTFAWKIAQSPLCQTLYVAPGNSGTAQIAQNINIGVTDFPAIKALVFEKQIDMVVVGPEDPLVQGVHDYFLNDNELKHVAVIGPKKAAAELEGSKEFAKEFMMRHHIPTAAYKSFSKNNVEEGYKFLETLNPPYVLKADGLAAGKGVLILKENDEAISAIQTILVKKTFGDAGNRIIVEERIDGIEASYIALSDGDVAIPMATSQDHKRIFDNDEGPNTGGMGAYSPTAIIDDNLTKIIQEEIIEKTIHAMKKEGIVFKGFLYAGIMIRDGKPFVLEYNVRMGDPECQPITMRMDFDLYDYLVASVDGTLSSLPPTTWKLQSAVCVVLASMGYPESYSKNDEITGFDSVSNGAIVFHAGTKKSGEKILSNGGRVLGVTALGDTLESAIKNAYAATEKIIWSQKFNRKDIGQKGLSYL